MLFKLFLINLCIFSAISVGCSVNDDPCYFCYCESNCNVSSITVTKIANYHDYDTIENPNKYDFISSDVNVDVVQTDNSIIIEQGFLTGTRYMKYGSLKIEVSIMADGNDTNVLLKSNSNIEIGFYFGTNIVDVGTKNTHNTINFTDKHLLEMSWSPNNITFGIDNIEIYSTSDNIFPQGDFPRFHLETENGIRVFNFNLNCDTKLSLSALKSDSVKINWNFMLISFSIFVILFLN